MKLRYIEIVIVMVVISLGAYMLVDGIFFENNKIADTTNKQHKNIQNDSKKSQKNNKTVKKDAETDENTTYELINIEASSTLADQGSNTYVASNLIDSNSRTCWSEGVSGSGIGEYITFDYSGPVSLKSIVVSNGYRKTSKLYYQNNRVKSMKVVYDDGYSQLLEFTDSFENSVQSFDLNTLHKTKQVKLYIEDVYAGSTYDDTSIDEIAINLK